MTYSQIDKMFDSFFSQPTYSSMVLKNQTNAGYEINETKDGAYLIFNVPGFNKTNLKVELEGGVIFVEGVRTYKLNGEDVEKTVHQKFKIGSEYDSENIEATIEDGILTIFVTKNKKSDKKKRISLL